MCTPAEPTFKAFLAPGYLLLQLALLLPGPCATYWSISSPFSSNPLGNSIPVLILSTEHIGDASADLGPPGHHISFLIKSLSFPLSRISSLNTNWFLPMKWLIFVSVFYVITFSMINETWRPDRHSTVHNPLHWASFGTITVYFEVLQSTSLWQMFFSYYIFSAFSPRFSKKKKTLGKASSFSFPVVRVPEFWLHLSLL